eukprot:10056157-Ditylum_brightwellii.AAC.1
MVNNLTFGELNYDVKANRKRKFMTKVNKSIQIYKRDITQVLQDPTFTAMMEELDNVTDPVKVIVALERIDTSIDETVTSTYSNLTSTPKHWWLEDIHLADLIVQYWSAVVIDKDGVSTSVK